MSSVNHMREFICERLSIAAEEIFLEFEKTINQYEEQIKRQQKLIDTTWKPQIILHRADSHSSLEIAHKDYSETDVLNNLQLYEETLNQNPDQAATESVHIKEEGEEGLLTSHPVYKNEPQTFSFSPIDEGSSPTDLEPSNTFLPEHLQVEEGGDEISEAVFPETSKTDDRTDTRENLISCQVCGNTFTQSNNLRRHMLTHTGEKPYTCKVCGKCFRHTPTLVRHRRTHTGEKPYTCQVCGKCFRHSNTLVGHMRTHTGEKPFNCEECGKCYAWKCMLVRHMRTHRDN